MKLVDLRQAAKDGIDPEESIGAYVCEANGCFEQAVGQTDNLWHWCAEHLAFATQRNVRPRTKEEARHREGNEYSGMDCVRCCMGLTEDEWQSQRGKSLVRCKACIDLLAAALAKMTKTNEAS